MPKPIILNAFAMNTPSHLSPGLWRHPRDRGTSYTSLATWIDLAQLLERGGFSALLLADSLGTYESFGASRDPAYRHGLHCADQRSAAARVRHGGRGPPSRLRGHLFGILRTPVRTGASLFDPRPSHRGPHRLKHRDFGARQRGSQLRPAAAAPGTYPDHPFRPACANPMSTYSVSALPEAPNRSLVLGGSARTLDLLRLAALGSDDVVLVAPAPGAAVCRLSRAARACGLIANRQHSLNSSEE